MSTLTLFNGSFESSEGIELIRKMLRIKIEFQENKIQGDSSEEEIYMREKRIKQLQYELDQLNQMSLDPNKLMTIQSEVSFA